VPEEGREYNLVGKRETALPGEMDAGVAMAFPDSAKGHRDFDVVLGEIVTLAAELRNDGTALPRDEALNLAVSARTLLNILKQRGADE
jgi:hypothetical protein